MRRKSAILCFVMAIFGILSVFSFAGCGTTIKDLTQTFETLNKAYEQNSEVFVKGTLLEGALDSSYVVNYGDVVNGFVKSTESKYSEFEELETKYNAMLAISQKYIDDNKSYILNFGEEDLSKSAKKSLTTLEKSIKNYTSSMESFVSARKTMVSFFSQFNGENAMNDETNLSHLMVFKKSYAKLIEANINLANDLSETVELTKIFDLLKETTTTKADVGLVKDYLQVKLLSVYNRFMIDEIANHLTWSNYSGKNARIDNLISSIENSFEYFKSNFVLNEFSRNFEVDEMEKLLDLSNYYILASEEYFEALDDFDFEVLAKDLDCDIDKYMLKNSFAETDLNKIEQFVNITTPTFMQKALEYLY